MNIELGKNMRPRFDPVIHLGHLLTAGSFIIFGIGAWYGVKSDIASVEFRVAAMERSVTKLAGAMEKIADKAVIDAQQSERINGLDRRVDSNDRRIDRLEGRGNVLPH